MRISFYEPKSAHYHFYSRTPVPRLGALVLAPRLKEQGHSVTVQVEECAPLDFEELAASDLVCISSITATAPRGYAIADRLKERRTTVVHGGIHVSFVPDEALEHGDFVIRSEGEGALSDLVMALDRGQDPSGIANLSFKRDGNRIHNPARPLLADLDREPIPDYSSIRGWSNRHGRYCVSTSRGCPHRCGFCSVKGIFGGEYRFKSVERVLEELALFAPRATHVFVTDDNFAADVPRAKRILEGLLRKGIRTEYSVQARSDSAEDAVLLDLMERTNCWAVCLGLDSIHPASLSEFGKKAAGVEKAMQHIRRFREKKIRVHGMFILGLGSEETVESIRSTVHFARETRIDTAQFSLLTPFLGAPIREKFEGEGRIFNHDWRDYDGLHAVVYPPRMSPYRLQKEMLRALTRFYTLRSALKSVLEGDRTVSWIRFLGFFATRVARLGYRGYLERLRALAPRTNRKALAKP